MAACQAGEIVTRRQTISSLHRAKRERTPLTWLTCYDYSFARALNDTELDLILVGDSGGMVALGYPDTSPVSMEEMLILASAVRRGAPDKFLVGDMPRGSYERSNETAIDHAMAFSKLAGVDAVKLEGGTNMASRVSAIAKSGISVIGHIGLTPQSASALGGYRVVGRESDEAQRIRDDARALEAAGAVALLLEALPPSLGREISSELNIPVLGIGAGPHVDGQLLILHDLLGLYPDFRPKFARCFVPDVLDGFSQSLYGPDADLEARQRNRTDGLLELTRRAVSEFINATRAGTFPDERFCYDG